MPIFDRFVRYEWAERALEVAVKKESARILQSWLLEQGLGTESTRRTCNVLSHLWLVSMPSTSQLKIKEEAIHLFASVAPQDRIALHWGMALLQFPLFHETAQIIGRLGKLQKECHKSEVINRVLERHSNQTTIRRAVERILQTMKDWSILEEKSKGLYLLKGSYSIQSAPLSEWLFRALLSVNTEKYWLLHDLLYAAEFFPFDLSAYHWVLRQSTQLAVERDSFGEEIIGMKYV